MKRIIICALMSAFLVAGISAAHRDFDARHHDLLYKKMHRFEMRDRDAGRNRMFFERRDMKRTDRCRCEQKKMYRKDQLRERHDDMPRFRHEPPVKAHSRHSDKLFHGEKRGNDKAFRHGTMPKKHRSNKK